VSDTPITPNTGQAFINGAAPTQTQVTFTQWAATIVDAISRIFTWASMPNTGIPAQGQPIQFTGWASAFFQVTGTFGAAGSVQLEGSEDGQTWVKLSPAALTGAGAFAALGATERPRYIRPHVTNGDGTTSLTVAGNLAFA